VTRRAFKGSEFFALPEDQQRSLLRSGNLVFCRTEPQVSRGEEEDEGGMRRRKGGMRRRGRREGGRREGRRETVLVQLPLPP